MKVSVWNYHCRPISQWHKNNTNQGPILHISCQYFELVNSSTSASFETSGPINNTTSAPSGRVQSKAILLNGRNSLLRKTHKDKYSHIHTCGRLQTQQVKHEPLRLRNETGKSHIDFLSPFPCSQSAESEYKTVALPVCSTAICIQMNWN